VAAVWIVSEESSLAAILAHHVSALGETFTGPPERSQWKAAPAPDLLILVGVTETGGGSEVLERLLGFVRELPARRRAAPPVLLVAADGGAAGLARLFDDRPAAALEFPFDPEDLEARARELLAQGSSPASLRERARQGWVRAEVERQYASLELPALRQAVDPRNAHRPLLFLGEPGSRRDLLARYVHSFAEPPRDAFARIALADVAPGELESTLLARTAGRRATVHLAQLERAPRAQQDELANFLGASGALGVEPIRWIASAVDARRLIPALRALPWLRVELPPLRARPDRALVVAAAFRAAVARAGREVELDPAHRDAWAGALWPGNLAELDRALDDWIGGSSAPKLVASLEPASAPAPLAPPPATDEDLMLETLAPEPPESELAELEELELVDLADEEREPAPLAPPAPAAAPAPEPAPAARVTALGPSLRELLVPLAHEVRRPLRALRTYAGLVEQRPNDAGVRRELRALVDEDLGRVDESLQRIERFVRFGAPEPRPFDLAAALAAELDTRQAAARARELVVLRELEPGAPPLVADEVQVRFAIGALLDRALRLVPRGGDVYLGSAWSKKRDLPAHRILLRFHSPEDVLTGPLDDPDAAFVEVVIARELFARAGGSFAVDASGPQDNVILVELPG